MSTERTDNTATQSEQAPESGSPAEPERQHPEPPDANTANGGDVKKPDPVRRLTLIVVCVIIVLFVWYVAADRFAPWTDEARVQGYIVPIVAEVSGRVLEVNVDNDQVVKTGEALLHIDPRNYEIAVRRAQAALDTAGQQVGASAAGVKSAAAKISDNRARSFVTSCRLTPSQARSSSPDTPVLDQTSRPATVTIAPSQTRLFRRLLILPPDLR